MELTPAIRTRYRAYILTNEWKTRRNRVLKLAGYRCEKCGAKRDLQVHHKTYEHLGCEPDGDLEVLCPDCHRGHHLEHPAENIKLYLKIAHEVVAANPFAGTADMAEAFKVCCAKLHIPYNSLKVASALSLVCGKSVVPERTVRRDGRPVDPLEISKNEARELLTRLGMDVLIKTIPSTPGSREIDIYALVERDQVLHDRY
jgi:hypothetical protein